MRIASVCLLAVFAFVHPARPARLGDSYDFSAPDRLWPILDELKANREPAKNEWDYLFESPGNKLIYNKPGFIENMKMVFMPRRKADLVEALRKEANHWLLDHYIAIRDNLAQLKAFEERLKANDFMPASIKMAADLLPPGTTEKYPHPPVYFNILQPDGQANGNAIYFDLMHTMDLGDRLVAVFAHESHHCFRSQLNRLSSPAPGTPNYGYVHAINQLALEGIADNIDKAYPLTPYSPKMVDYCKAYNASYENSPAVFKEIDQMIRDAKNDPSKTKEIGDSIFSKLKFGGHPNGFYMASLIRKHLGKQALIDSVDDAFEFLRQYQQAAKKEPGAYVFSDAAMEFLEALEAQYVRPKLASGE